MKTYQEWEDSELDLDAFLSVNDEIDYEIYEHILCALCPPNYDDGIIAQCGEASYERKGIYYYDTVKCDGDKYFYLGILPDKNKEIIEFHKKLVDGIANFVPRKYLEMEIKVGDPVLVVDQGLLMLQKFAPKNAFPNNYGRVSEIWDDRYLVEFPLRDENNKLGYDKHSQVAPYPKNIVQKRELYKKL